LNHVSIEISKLTFGIKRIFSFSGIKKKKKPRIENFKNGVEKCDFVALSLDSHSRF